MCGRGTQSYPVARTAEAGRWPDGLLHKYSWKRLATSQTASEGRYNMGYSSRGRIDPLTILWAIVKSYVRNSFI